MNSIYAAWLISFSSLFPCLSFPRFDRGWIKEFQGMNEISGKCSEFGGQNDSGMCSDSGLALYEKWESDLRPDLFRPSAANDTFELTWKRLRADSPYVALRFKLNLRTNRCFMQTVPIKITNPKTGQYVVGFVVDYGPSPSTGRLIDLSPRIMKDLRLQTDDDVQVQPLTEENIFD